MERFMRQFFVEINAKTGDTHAPTTQTQQPKYHHQCDIKQSPFMFTNITEKLLQGKIY